MNPKHYRRILADTIKEISSADEMDKAIKSPSKHIPLARLKQIKQDHAISEGGQEYSEQGLDEEIVNRQVSQADRMVRDAERQEREAARRAKEQEQGIGGVDPSAFEALFRPKIKKSELLKSDSSSKSKPEVFNGHEPVQTTIGSGRHRQLRNHLISLPEGKAHKKDIEKMGFNLQAMGLSQALDGKGHLHHSKVTSEIEKMPQMTYGASHSTYGEHLEDVNQDEEFERQYQEHLKNFDPTDYHVYKEDFLDEDKVFAYHMSTFDPNNHVNRDDFKNENDYNDAVEDAKDTWAKNFTLRDYKNFRKYAHLADEDEFIDQFEYQHALDAAGERHSDRFRFDPSKLEEGGYFKAQDEQRHSLEPSEVFQLNYTPEHEKQMKEAGVFDTFKKMLEASRSSAHPVADKTLGWVRYTKGEDAYHIDEIQSDFGQSFIKQGAAQIKQAMSPEGFNANGQIVRLTPEEGTRHLESLKAKYPDDHFNKISQILFGGKHPNEIIHESFLQHLRNKGETGKQVHIWDVKPKAKLSSQRTTEAPPAHMQFTYNQSLPKLGYKKGGQYGQIETQTNPNLKGQETHVQTLAKKELILLPIKKTAKKLPNPKDPVLGPNSQEKPISSDYEKRIKQFLKLKKKDVIPGGLAEGKKPSDFPKFRLAEGVKVEMEHTSDPKVAEEIAMDHLTEDPKYYEKLKTIETKKSEPLMKPYSSEAQRRWAHTPAGTKALGGKKAVKEWDEASRGKDLPEKIEKMSRPRITFPKLQGITTRPDQNVRMIENERQKEIYGKQIANARFGNEPEKFDRPKRLEGSNKPLYTRKELIDAYGARIGNKFGTSALGLNVQTSQGPKAGALAGKLRSKFEPGDEKYEQKLKEHAIKVEQAKKQHFEKLKEWKEKADTLPSGSNEYWTHVANKPKFKNPRRPSKGLKETSTLGAEGIKSRGKSVGSTIEHEGLHYILSEVENKHGPVAANRVVQLLLEQHHPKAIDVVHQFITKHFKYNPRSESFNEELLAHSRDIITDPKKREQLKHFLTANMYGRMIDFENKDRQAFFNEIVGLLKRGHQKAYEKAQQIELKDIRPDLVPASNKKLAASEEMKKSVARRIFGGIDASKLPGRDKVNEWQESVGFLQDKDSSYDEETHQAARREIPRMEEGLRLRALNKLANRTLTRKHPETGRRQFLLFRGVGPNERQAVLDGGFVQHDDHSSWTPHIGTAKGFEGDYQTEEGPARTIAAWVDEDKIHAAPHMYGNMPGLQMDMDNAGEFYTPENNFPGKNQFNMEHEIIVAPHTSDRATKGDVKRYHAIHTPTRTKMAQTDPKKDLHARINYRGEQDRSGFRSTKNYPLIRETKPLPSHILQAAGFGMKKPKKLAASEEMKKAPIPNPIDPDDEVWQSAYSLSYLKQNWKPDKSASHPHVTVKRPDNTYYHRIFGQGHVSHLISSDKEGEDPIAHMIVVQEDKSSIPKVIESTVDSAYRNRGFGKALYLNAIKHHKKLQSDTLLSPEANRLYAKLSRHPNVKATLSPFNEESDTSHFLEFVEKPKKMAASEEGKKDNDTFSRKHVENHIASLYAGAHDKGEDPDSGIPDFHASDFYKLQSIPIDQVNKESAPSKHLVRKYKDLYQKGMEFPPIVLSKLNNEIMDGRHRVQAARELGLTHIHAYVPVKEENE